jgi:hypothetical protein
VNAEFNIASWRGDELPPSPGLIDIPGLVLDELSEVVRYLGANPMPPLSLLPDDFALTATAAFGHRVRDELDTGLGFALLDRLPVEHWTLDQCRAVYWLLGRTVGRPVAQSHDGKMLYDVKDSGRPVGYGVRPDVTNIGQNFHTDNSYNTTPPEVVGLMCIHPAREGGLSGIVNFHWAHKELVRRAPGLVKRLHEPFYFDRQREHAEADIKYISHPLFEARENQLVGRLSKRQVVYGYKLAESALDARGEQALEAFDALMNEPGVPVHFDFEPGQIQFINNLVLGHNRTAFVDYEEPEKRRHLVRLWLRDQGRPGYEG